MLNLKIPEDKAKALTREMRTLYIAPNPPELPDDGLLNYVVFSSLQDFWSIEDRSVCLVDMTNPDLLKVLVNFKSLLEVNLVVMLGIPKVEYSVLFDDAVWELERVSYSTFISELALALEARNNTEAINATEHDKERKSYVRTNGSVKSHDPLVLKEDEDDDIAED